MRLQTEEIQVHATELTRLADGLEREAAARAGLEEVVRGILRAAAAGGADVVEVFDSASSSVNGSSAAAPLSNILGRLKRLDSAGKSSPSPSGRLTVLWLRQELERAAREQRDMKANLEQVIGNVRSLNVLSLIGAEKSFPFFSCGKTDEQRVSRCSCRSCWNRDRQKLRRRCSTY